MLPANNKELFVKLANGFTAQELAFSITANKAQDVQYKVLSFDGKVCTSGVLHLVSAGTNSFRIPVQQLPSGSYVLYISTHSAFASAPFIKL